MTNVLHALGGYDPDNLDQEFFYEEVLERNVFITTRKMKHFLTGHILHKEIVNRILMMMLKTLKYDQGAIMLKTTWA